MTYEKNDIITLSEKNVEKEYIIAEILQLDSMQQELQLILKIHL